MCWYNLVQHDYSIIASAISAGEGQSFSVIVWSCLNHNLCLYWADVILAFYSGIVATVFGATGFLGRYLVHQLGEMIRLWCYINRVINWGVTQTLNFIQPRWDLKCLSHSEGLRIVTATWRLWVTWVRLCRWNIIQVMLILLRLLWPSQMWLLTS